MRLPETRYARSGDIRIAYQVTGQGSLDLVYVPGFLSNLDLHWEDPGYTRLMRRLAGFARLISFDKRGTGLSDRVDPARLPDLATRMDDVRAVMDAAGSGRAALLGAGDGAPIAMLFAATCPERTRSLVLYGGYAQFHRWVMAPGEVERFEEQAERSWGTGATLRGFAPGRTGDPQFSAWWARLERLSCSPTAAIALARMNAGIDLRHVLPGISAPTLVLHRTGDVRVNLAAGRYLAAHIPGARFQELAGRDHPLWTGDVDAAVDAIEAFLTGMPPRTEPRRVLAALLAARVLGPARNGAALRDRDWNERLERLGAAAAVLARQFGGHAPEARGETLLLRFDGSGRAARCAGELAAAARACGLRLALGLHVGEVDAAPATQGGITRHVAECIAAAASAGEVLASALAADLAVGAGLNFAPRGDLVVDGLDRPLPLVALILEQHLEPAHRSPAAPDLTRLSAREREVLALVAEGLSNPVIAGRLDLSDHTVKRHVANILTKLDLPTRTAAAALVARQPPA